MFGIVDFIYILSVGVLVKDLIKLFPQKIIDVRFAQSTDCLVLNGFWISWSTQTLGLRVPCHQSIFIAVEFTNSLNVDNKVILGKIKVSTSNVRVEGCNKNPLQSLKI
ncbi:hypothetical protein ACOSQ3_001703 [Xanthoceras sorbifolium]